MECSRNRGGGVLGGLLYPDLTWSLFLHIHNRSIKLGQLVLYIHLLPSFGCHIPVLALHPPRTTQVSLREIEVRKSQESHPEDGLMEPSENG